MITEDEIKLQPGDRVKITEGHHRDKTGTFKKYFKFLTDYCQVTLDLTGRKRVPEVILVEHKYVEWSKEGNDGKETT